MASLNLDISFLENRKTRRLVARLGEGAEIYLIRLWLHAAKVCPKDGLLKGYEACDIETEVLWRGQLGILTDVLTDLRFILKRRSGFQIHDWQSHNGHIVSYSVRASAAATARWDRIREQRKADAPSNASSIKRQYPKPSQPSQPELSLANEAKPSASKHAEHAAAGDNGKADGIARDDVGAGLANGSRRLKANAMLLELGIKPGNLPAAKSMLAAFADPLGFLCEVVDRGKRENVRSIGGYVYAAIKLEADQRAKVKAT